MIWTWCKRLLMIGSITTFQPSTLFCERLLKNMQKVVRAVPNEYHCPITREVMKDPVVASDGYTYERKGISKWLEHKVSSPLTNLDLKSRILYENKVLRTLIRESSSDAARKVGMQHFKMSHRSQLDTIAQSLSLKIQ
jgi:hypothetical protein